MVSLLTKHGSLVLLLAGLAAVCSCGRSGSTLDPENRILGTWVSEDGQRVTTFQESGEYSQVFNDETYYSMWSIQGDSVRYTGMSSTNTAFEADPYYVGFSSYSFDIDGNLVLDGRTLIRQQ